MTPTSVFFLMTFFFEWSLLTSGQCRETVINFSRNYTAVVFDPYVSSEDRFNYNYKGEHDLHPLLAKIHTRFDNVMVNTEPRDGTQQDFVSVAVAKYNTRLTSSGTSDTRMFQVWLNDNMAATKSINLTVRLATLYAQAEDANQIFSGTVTTILLDYSSLDTIDQTMVAKDLELTKSIFQEENVTYSYQIGVVLPINTRATINQQELFSFLTIPKILSQVDIAVFSMVPNANYIKDSNGAHVNYFINKFEQTKRILHGLVRIPIVFKTTWPDTSLTGFTSFGHLTEFWRGIGAWAEEKKNLVIFDSVFDTPYSSSPYDTSGMWRLVSRSLYENITGYIFEEKFLLCDTPPINHRKNFSLLRPDEPASFSRDRVAIRFDSSKLKVVRFTSDTEELIKLFEEYGELVSRRFGTLFKVSAGDGEPFPNMELLLKSIATVNNKLAKNGSGGVQPMKMMVTFSGGDLDGAKRDFDLIKKYAEDANNIFPSTVTTFILEQDYNERDVEIFNHVRSSQSKFVLGRVFGLHVCYSHLIVAKDHGNILFRLVSLTDLKMLVFVFRVNQNWLKLGWERATALTTASFETCKRRIRSVAPDLDVAFFTSWKDTDDSGTENYAQMVNYWENLGNWAKATNTTVIFEGAFEGNGHDSCGWWVVQSNQSAFLSSGFQFVEKKTIVQKMLGQKRRTTKVVDVTPEQDQQAVWGLLEISGVVVGILIFLSGIILGVFLFLRRRRSRQLLPSLEVEEFFNGGNDQSNSYSRNPYEKGVWEVSENCYKVETHKILGSGEYGVVCLGFVNNSEGKGVEVAVKMCQPGSITALKGLLSEIKILSYLGKHENVVSLIGAHTDLISLGKVYVFVELCGLGSLLKFIRKLRCEAEGDPQRLQVHKADLECWSREVVSGMEFLAEKRIVHADLAARNVLLTSDKTAKISDFGLSRRLYNYSQYVKKQQEPLPWRWMAPESLRLLEFNESSDVWAFGVTLWEILTFGAVPYQGLAWKLDFANRLENGLVLDKPWCCDPHEYAIMLKCWAINPALRPTFAQLNHDMSLQLYVNDISGIPQ